MVNESSPDGKVGLYLLRVWMASSAGLERRGEGLPSPKKTPYFFMRSVYCLRNLATLGATTIRQ